MLYDTTDLPAEAHAAALVAKVRAAIVHLDHGPVGIADDGITVLITAPDEYGLRLLLATALEEQGWRVTGHSDDGLAVQRPAGRFDVGP